MKTVTTVKTTKFTNDPAITFANRVMCVVYAIIVAFLLASALAGCGLECTPKETPATWEIDWRGFMEIPRTDRAIQIVVEHTPCDSSCVGGGRVSFWPYPFECGAQNTPVVGCMPWGEGVADFAIGYAVPLSSSALPDEIGHYLWNMCGLGIGEDARGAYTPEFVAWLSQVRTAMQAEGL